MFRVMLVALVFVPALNAEPPTCHALWLWTAPESSPATVAWAAKQPIPTVPVRPCYCGVDCKCKSCDGKDCHCSQAECYTSLRARSIKENKPLIVSVGYEPIKVDGMLSCRYDAMPGAKSPSMVVGSPSGPNLLMAGTLSSKATAADVRGLLAPRPVPMPQSY